MVSVISAASREQFQGIDTDPAIAAKTLKLANYAYCGLRSKVSSLARATGLLGNKNVADINTERSHEALQQLLRTQPGAAECIQFVSGDVAGVCDCQHIVSHTLDQPGGLDIVVNSGGIRLITKLMTSTKPTLTA